MLLTAMWRAEELVGECDVGRPPSRSGSVFPENTL
jgi:hypothetical protein